MKIYRNAPQTERLICHAGTENQYEFWVMVAVPVGSAERVGPNHIRCNGKLFKNLGEAMDDCLAQSPAELQAHKRPETVTIAGAYIAAHDKWTAFCKLRGLSNLDMAAMQANHTLTAQEMKQLGLDAEGN